MARPKLHNVTKHTLHLRAGDYAFLTELKHGVSAAFLIREIVSRFVDRQKALQKPRTIDEIVGDLTNE